MQCTTSVSLEGPVRTSMALSPAHAYPDTLLVEKESVRMSTSVAMATWDTRNVWCKTIWGHATTLMEATVAGVFQDLSQTQLTEERSVWLVTAILTELQARFVMETLGCVCVIPMLGELTVGAARQDTQTSLTALSALPVTMDTLTARNAAALILESQLSIVTLTPAHVSVRQM